METSKQATDAYGVTEEERAKWARQLKWNWVEAGIWTEAMLIALDNGVKGGRWFSLIDKVYRRTTLKEAWRKVRANKGAAGVDKQTIDMFEAQEDKYLKELEHGLGTGTYHPKAVRREYIPKGQGKMRPLGIPTVKDRIAQQAVKMALEPIFEKEFLDMSYGFRPNKGAQMAINEVTSRNSGMSVNAVILRLNPILRGWYNYFKNVTKYTLGTFDSFVRRRLRAIIE